MGKRFTLDFQVRDYELDQYGVVNNAVYQQYLEHTRHEFLVSIGIGPAEVAAAGRSLTLSRVEIRYRSPLRSREEFRVELSVSRLTGVRARFHQRILRLPGLEAVLDAQLEALFLDGRGRPMRIPQEHTAGLRAYLAEPEDGPAAKK